MIRSWTPRPLSIEYGVIGAEEGTPEEWEADRQRAARATPEMKLEAWRLWRETNEEIARVLGAPRTP